MKVFADTSYYLALLSPHDSAHSKAVELSREDAFEVVTTGFVVIEVGNALARPEDRRQFPGFLAALRSDSMTSIIDPSQDLLDAGIDFFTQRPDKSWSLTDCISFVVMHERGVHQALTADHHFEQAGFVALLK